MGIVVLTHQEDLWRDRVIRAHHRVQPLALPDLFGEAEIGELQVAVRTNQNVLCFQIAVDVSDAVAVLQRECDLGDV